MPRSGRHQCGGSRHQSGSPPGQHPREQGAVRASGVRRIEVAKLGRKTTREARRGVKLSRVSDAPTVSIAASRPLLRAGLERIAHDAHTAITTAGDADIVLRAGEGPTSGDLEVVVDEFSVFITCRTEPDARVWDAVRRLIGAAVS